MAAGLQDLGFYLTKCKGIGAEYNDDTSTRSLAQILHENVGDTLESAVHFSFIYEFKWLLDQYPDRELSMRLVVQKGDISEKLEKQLKDEQRMNLKHNASLLPIETPKFGWHHSKMILLKYKNSLRILVSTANLCEPDWSKKSQMVWVSPLLKKVGPKKGEDSSTGFRSSLCEYLKSYDNEELSDVADKLEDYDFSQIQSYFIFSTPKLESGLDKLSPILESKLPTIPNKCPVTFCFSSFGNLGEDADEWFRPAFGTRLLSSGGQRPGMNDVTKDNIKPIFPTAKQAKDGGYTLTYREETHNGQGWISGWLHKWKADGKGRSGTAPHVKFYIRTSEDYKHTYWFLMSSANLSKAAWGGPWNGSEEWRKPLSYECGVLHIPKHVLAPFDLPPKRYGANDKVCVTTS